MYFYILLDFFDSINEDCKAMGLSILILLVITNADHKIIYVQNCTPAIQQDSEMVMEIK